MRLAPRMRLTSSTVAGPRFGLGIEKRCSATSVRSGSREATTRRRVDFETGTSRPVFGFFRAPSASSSRCASLLAYSAAATGPRMFASLARTWPASAGSSNRPAAAAVRPATSCVARPIVASRSRLSRSAGPVAPQGIDAQTVSVVFPCRSVQGAVPPDAARQTPTSFNQANATTKTANGSPRRFREWTLAQSIDVACEVDAPKLDVRKSSHDMRDFRSGIRPYLRMASGFTPDQRTARLCVQVPKVALASPAGERP